MDFKRLCVELCNKFGFEQSYSFVNMRDPDPSQNPEQIEIGSNIIDAVQATLWYHRALNANNFVESVYRILGRYPTSGKREFLIIVTPYFVPTAEVHRVFSQVNYVMVLNLPAALGFKDTRLIKNIQKYLQKCPGQPKGPGIAAQLRSLTPVSARKGADTDTRVKHLVIGSAGKVIFELMNGSEKRIQLTRMLLVILAALALRMRCDTLDKRKTPGELHEDDLVRLYSLATRTQNERQNPGESLPCEKAKANMLKAYKRLRDKLQPEGLLSVLDKYAGSTTLTIKGDNIRFDKSFGEREENGLLHYFFLHFDKYHVYPPELAPYLPHKS